MTAVLRQQLFQLPAGTVLAVGLDWELCPADPVDLDLSAICFSGAGELLEVIFFNHPQPSDPISPTTPPFISLGADHRLGREPHHRAQEQEGEPFRMNDKNKNNPLRHPLLQLYAADELNEMQARLDRNAAPLGGDAVSPPYAPAFSSFPFSSTEEAFDPAEQLTLVLDRVPQEVAVIFLTVSAYNGKSFRSFQDPPTLTFATVEDEPVTEEINQPDRNNHTAASNRTMNISRSSSSTLTSQKRIRRVGVIPLAGAAISATSNLAAVLLRTAAFSSASSSSAPVHTGFDASSVSAAWHRPGSSRASLFTPAARTWDVREYNYAHFGYTFVDALPQMFKTLGIPAHSQFDALQRLPNYLLTKHSVLNCYISPFSSLSAASNCATSVMLTSAEIRLGLSSGRQSSSVDEVLEWFGLFFDGAGRRIGGFGPGLLEPSPAPALAPAPVFLPSEQIIPFHRIYPKNRSTPFAGKKSFVQIPANSVDARGVVLNLDLVPESTATVLLGAVAIASPATSSSSTSSHSKEVWWLSAKDKKIKKPAKGYARVQMDGIEVDRWPFTEDVALGLLGLLRRGSTSLENSWTYTAVKEVLPSKPKTGLEPVLAFFDFVGAWLAKEADHVAFQPPWHPDSSIDLDLNNAFHRAGHSTLTPPFSQSPDATEAHRSHANVVRMPLWRQLCEREGLLQCIAIEVRPCRLLRWPFGLPDRFRAHVQLWRVGSLYLPSPTPHGDRDGGPSENYTKPYYPAHGHDPKVVRYQSPFLCDRAHLFWSPAHTPAGRWLVRAFDRLAVVVYEHATVGKAEVPLMHFPRLWRRPEEEGVGSGGSHGAAPGQGGVEEWMAFEVALDLGVRTGTPRGSSPVQETAQEAEVTTRNGSEQAGYVTHNNNNKNSGNPENSSIKENGSSVKPLTYSSIHPDEYPQQPHHSHGGPAIQLELRRVPVEAVAAELAMRERHQQKRVAAHREGLAFVSHARHNRNFELCAIM